MRQLSLALLSFVVLSGCTAEPDAPDLATDAAVTPAEDAGAPVDPPWDSGPDLLADAGSTDIEPLAQDVGTMDPGEYDAGFTPPDPPEPPPEEDVCAEACLGMPCGRECRAQCRVALPGVPAEEREEYLRCINQTSCESWRCLPDREISQECQDVCDNRSLRQCSVELSADPTVCGHECEGLLAMMAPPARQAWLQCTINQCGIDRRRVNCDPSDYLGPAPTQACINRGTTVVQCERDRDRSAWAAAWECEGWRTPNDQSGLGGNTLVNCLSDATCAPQDWYRCMIQSQEYTGLGETVAELCRRAERCEGLGVYCQLMANGLTRAIGQTGLDNIHECLRNAGDTCEENRACIVGVWDPNAVEVHPLCRQACIGCGDPTEQCIHNCSRMRNSMSREQTATYDTCIRNRAAARQCGEFLPTTCLPPALPTVADTCRRYVDHMVDRCPGTRFYNPSVLQGWCALSGVRSGLTNLRSLTECIDRTGCGAVNLWETCTR